MNNGRLYDDYYVCGFLVYTCGSFENKEDCSNSSFIKNCKWGNSSCIEIKSRICSQKEDSVTVEKVYVTNLKLFIFRFDIVPKLNV